MSLTVRSDLSRLPLSALLAIALAAPVAGWTPKAQLTIAGEAVRLTPPDFYRQIEKHERAFAEGVLLPYSAHRDGSWHYKNPDGGGRLDKVIQVQVERTIEAIQSHQPFQEVVRQAGVVAYYVATANNPLNTSSADRSEADYYKDFAQYLESVQPRLPVIFYGLQESLDGGDKTEQDLQRFIAHILDRGRELYPLVGQEYRRIGKLPGRQYFDDRSTAFGVSSVAFSRAVSDVALVLRYVWIRSGGADQRNAPRAEQHRLVLVSETPTATLSPH